MKKFMKGVRFTPKNYSDEVEAKIQHYKKEGYNCRCEAHSAPRSSWPVSAQAPKSTLPCWIISPRTFAKACPQLKLTIWCIASPQTTTHPRPLHVRSFPKSVCTSINDVVCHGIPSTREFLKSGDIVNVDVSTIYKGYFADASRMFMIGEVSPDMQRLVQVTKECRDIGIQTAQPWARLGDVGAAIQEHAEKNGYSVVRDLCGHGCGVKFHEEPDVEHFGKRGTGMLIVPGMTFTIEPMINMGSYEVFIDEADGWTVCTDDGLPSAQWESQILITEDGNEILTQ